VEPVLSQTRPHTTYLIGRLDRIVRRALEERLRRFDLTVLGYTALTVLAARPGLSNAQLARRSFMTPQGMNQAITVLVDKGLVRRTPDVDNRRVQRIKLTSRGRSVVAKCTAEVEDYERELLDSLGLIEQMQLNELLQTVVNENRRR
jgi:DNA-binding MarR family transcriptional regulator